MVEVYVPTSPMGVLPQASGKKTQTSATLSYLARRRQMDFPHGSKEPGRTPCSSSSAPSHRSIWDILLAIIVVAFLVFCPRLTALTLIVAPYLRSSNADSDS